ncbi:hypothetical protein MTO96_026039 [Rhipicephalus appendiculatus]
MYLDSVECFEPYANTWTRISSFPYPRSCAKMVAHENSLYIVGGCDDNGKISSVVELDLRRERSSELQSMPTPRCNFGAAVLEGCIYTIGGFHENRTAVQLVEKYDIAARRWIPAPDLPAACGASTACVVRDIDDPHPWI